MQTAELIAYTSMLFSMTIAPGPCMAVVIARTLMKDIKGALAFILGLALARLVFFILVCAGLGLWIQSVPMFFLIGKCAAMLYLLWLAYSMWTHKNEDKAEGNVKKTGILSSCIAGFTTGAISPHYLLLFLLILPQILDVSTLKTSSIGLLAILTFAIGFTTFAGVIFITHRCGQLIKTSNDSSWLNRGLAVAVAASGGWMMSM
jgi:threonine/homoserine/homoserine lactone efflux protein